MIIYGTKGVHLNTRKSDLLVCPNCETRGNMEFSIYNKHAHVFWIPMFPMRKNGYAQCSNCKQVLESVNMPEEMRLEYDQVRSESKPRSWQFIGLLIVAVGVLMVFLNMQRESKREKEFIHAPQSGDVIEYVTETDNYSTFKIVDIDADTIYFFDNLYETNMKSGIEDIEIPSNYDTVLYMITKQELINLYEEGEIYDVNRE